VSPLMNSGNVHIAEITTTGTFGLANPGEEQPGAMYSFILNNTTGSNITLSLGDQYLFANGIVPNIVRAGKILVISAVCLSGNNFLCTWAEDFSS